MSAIPADHRIEFSDVDPEARLGLPAGRQTSPGFLSAFVLGVMLTAACLLIARLLHVSEASVAPSPKSAVPASVEQPPAVRPTAATSGAPQPAPGAERGAIPSKADAAGSEDSVRPLHQQLWDLVTKHYYVVAVELFLACWSFSFLFWKALKIRAQRRGLSAFRVVSDPGSALTAATAQGMLRDIFGRFGEPEKFLYLNRIIGALQSMRNVGRVADVDDVLRATAEADESIMDSGYTMLNGFKWAIPVLGFIGTVFGLTEAMGKFTANLSANNDVQKIVGSLQKIMSGLDTAFVTTGAALVLVFLVHLVHIFVRKADEDLMDDARERANNDIVKRVRLEQPRQA